MTEISENINKVEDTPYAGFWYRLAALFVDGIFIMPFSILMMYMNSSSLNSNYLTTGIHLVFIFLYTIYCVKRYGGSPGKLIVGIKIVKLDGNNVDWKESILREIVSVFIALLGSVAIIIAVSKANANYYDSIYWYDQIEYLNSFTPTLTLAIVIMSNIWVYSELVVMLTNKKRRALHDFIAGTIVIMRDDQQRVIREEEANIE